MALSAGEYLSGGQVCDSQGRTVVISETAGAALSAGEQYSAGDLRDADGRMVICQDTLNAALGAGEVYSGGDVRDSMGRVAVAVDTVNANLSANEQISGGQVRDSLGRRVIAIDTLGAVLSAGEFFSGGNVLDKVGRTVVALESGGGGGTAYDTAVLADSPVSYWKTLETAGTSAADSAGTNTGTYTGGFTLAQPGPGAQGACGVALNGTTGYINVPHNANLAIRGTMTLEIWVKPTNFTNYNEMMTKGSGALAAPYEWRMEAASGVPSLYWDATPDGISASAALSLGVWTHLAVTLNGTTITHYKNGATNGSGTVSGTQAADAGNPLKIGQRDDVNAVTFFTGLVAKPAVYNTALSGARIAAHFAAA